MKEIQAFTQERREEGRVAEEARIYSRAIVQAIKLSSIYNPAAEFLAGLGTVVVVWLGGRYILDTESEVKEAEDARALRRCEGHIEFRNVFFRYVEGQPVLEAISFEARPGELVAGHDVRGLTLSSLRGHISMVLQDVFLFNGTVRENILYGRPGAADEEVVAAAQAANAHEFIVLQDGRIVEMGRHADLVNGDGLYARLCRAQSTADLDPAALPPNG